MIRLKLSWTRIQEKGLKGVEGRGGSGEFGMIFRMLSRYHHIIPYEMMVVNATRYLIITLAELKLKRPVR